MLSPVGENLDASEVASSLSFVFGIIANELIELCIPHNILFSDKGSRIYVMLREFGEGANCFGWLEYSGVVPAHGAGVKEEDILGAKKQLRVPGKLLESLKRSVGKNLDHFI